MTKTSTQLDRDIAEALARPTNGDDVSTMASRTTRKTIHIGPGLKDGVHSAGTALYLRKFRALGATVTLAKTGRATVRDASGNVTVYTVDVPQNRAEADALLASNPDPESPLSRAYADLTLTAVKP